MHVRRQSHLRSLSRQCRGVAPARIVKRIRQPEPVAFQEDGKPGEVAFNKGINGINEGPLKDLYARMDGLVADNQKFKADIEELKADKKELNARVDNLQPAGDLVLLNVCAQVLDGLLFAAYSRIPPVAKPKKTKVYYKSTCTLFVQLYKRLSSKGIEDSTLKALAGSSPVKDFCKGADALMDARNLSVHPPILEELDRLVKDALKLVTPEVKARSPTLSRACDVLEQYEAVIRPAINSALISSRKRS
ncbi:hypothetical protein HYH02_005217 [Chlamydomonas schloesseri]|uniref:Uncharacterized protein n=1 Tax=Chlamydomonas schloesseri TaxID=2026947 RepID=A0A835WM15_9CHLO|nr:hypothetical protein HYH02_005217 [Chlamydomonas schloesseri]|eukprot:KAG2449689.1 hypothetical protein HYH02_005217 [Chlamydomonas schloesseri]